MTNKEKMAMVIDILEGYRECAQYEAEQSEDTEAKAYYEGKMVGYEEALKVIKTTF